MGLHTDIPSRRQIERLLQARGDQRVSIYLPTSPITPEADAARIAFKNLAAEAGAELRGASSDAADRETIEQRSTISTTISSSGRSRLTHSRSSPILTACAAFACRTG